MYKRQGYSLLGLISYLTAGKQEVRAWTITRGTKAPQAAGKIHTDFEKGFIRAEVVNYQDLLDCGSYTAAKDCPMCKAGQPVDAIMNGYGYSKL